MHTFQIGPHVYTLMITKNAIFNEKRKELTGTAVWKDRLLLISGVVPVEKREEVMVHEAVEAWEWHFPKPHDREKQRDWEASVHTQIRLDFERNGGVDALKAIEPTYVLPEPPPSASATEDEDDAKLRRLKFPDLDDEAFERAKSIWQARGLDPWTDSFYVREEFRPTDAGRKRVLRLVLLIEGIRSLAHASGEYAGMDEPTFVYTDDDNIPAKCVVNVYRLVGGEPRKFPGEVYWCDAYGKVPFESLDEAVQRNPRACLATKAEAKALSRAFPHQLAGTQHVDWLPRRNRQWKQAAKPMPSVGQTNAFAPVMPKATMQIHLTLVGLGMKSEHERLAHIARCVLDFGPRREGDEDDFYCYVRDRAKGLSPDKKPTMKVDPEQDDEHC